jgi:CubicO group peptidase (beta-lactamase class C family)
MNIKDILQQGVENKDFPGGQFCYIKDDQILCDTVGFKQIEPDLITNTGDEIYDVASLSKVISTTILAHKLIEDGVWTLDTLLKDILKRFNHHGITIKDLLIHSSGLKADVQRANKLNSKTELIDKLYQEKPYYDKGSMIVYSDIGYLLLGLAIEQTLEMPLDEAAYKYIFMPLGMQDTGYHPDIKRTAPTEFRKDEVYQGLLCGLVHDEKSFAMKGIAGHAGLFSTAKDIAIFIKAILDDTFVLKRETVLKMSTLEIEQNDQYGNLKARSLGYEKPSQDHVLYPYQDEVIMHTGFTGCNMMINLKRKTGFVLLTNAVHPKRELNHIFSYRNQIDQEIIKEWEKKNA